MNLNHISLVESNENPIVSIISNGVRKMIIKPSDVKLLTEEEILKLVFGDIIMIEDKIGRVIKLVLEPDRWLEIVVLLKSSGEISNFDINLLSIRSGLCNLPEIKLIKNNEIDTLTYYIQERDITINDLKLKNNYLENEFNKRENQNKKHIEQLENIKENYIHRIKNKNNELQKHTNDLGDKIKYQLEKLNEKNSEIESLKSLNEVLVSMLDNYKINPWELKHSELQKNLEYRENQVTQLSTKIKTLEHLRLKNNSLESEVNDLQIKNDKLTKDYAISQGYNETFCKDYENLLKRFDDYKNEVCSLLGRLSIFNKTNSELIEKGFNL